MYSLYNHLFYCLFRNVYFNFYIWLCSQFDRWDCLSSHWILAAIFTYIWFRNVITTFGITLWQVKDFIAHPGPWGNSTYWLSVLQHIILVVPFGFFVPVLINKVTNYKKARKWYVMTFLVWEILHLLTLSDVFDVWRIAINMLGASVGYLLFISIMQLDNKFKVMRKKIFEN